MRWPRTACPPDRSPGRRLTLPLLLLAVAAAGAGPGTVAPSKGEDALRFGVVGLYNPRLMFLKYQPLVDHLSRATGRQWELIVDSEYERTVERLCTGELEMALLGPLTYVRAHARCGALPLVKLRTRGRGTYESWIMVREDSAANSLADLRGRSFGFGAPLSTSSHLYPEAMMERAGVRTGVELECRFYGHHERAARAVLLREVDACGVRDIVGEKFLHRGLRRLASSEPIPNFPLVVRKDLPAGLADRIRGALLPPEGRMPPPPPPSDAWDVELAEGFAPADDAEYEPVRMLARQLHGPDALISSEATWRAHCEGR